MFLLLFVSLFFPAFAKAAPPVLSPIGNKSVNEGSKLTITLSATDADGDALTYSASNLPSGATFTASSKQFSWTPSYTQAGTYPGVRFQVSDGTEIDYEDITITVNDIDTTPSFDRYLSGNHFAFVGELFQLKAKAYELDGDEFTYTDPSSGSLPPNATFDPNTRIFSWTPSTSDLNKNYVVTFKVCENNHPTQCSTNNITLYAMNKSSDTVDLSGYLPPVGSQIGNSCVAWGVGYYAKTFQEGKEKGWDLTDPAHQCSPTFIYGQRGMSSGMYFSDAFDILKSEGCATMDVLPNSGAAGTVVPTYDQYVNAMPMRAQSSEIIYGKSQSEFIEKIKNHLRTGDIVITGSTTFSDYYNANGENDVYYGPSNSSTSVGSHALDIVGFDDNRSYKDPQGITHTGAFKAVNSWGKTWSGDGFVWLSYHFLASYGYAYKMVDRIGYQPEIIGKVSVYHPKANSELSLLVYPALGMDDKWITYFKDGQSSTGINFAIDLTDYKNYFPLSPTNKLYFRIADYVALNTGQIKSFSVSYGGNTYSAAGLPVDIPDNDPSGVKVYIDNSQLNIPPTQPTSVIITPSSPKTTDNLTCTASGSTDADNDPITYKYTWKKNDVIQDNVNSATVSNTLTAKNEIWKCVATPNDTKQDGPSAEAQTIIQNSLPVFADIPAQQVSEGSLLAFTVSATDADNDPLVYSAVNLPAGATFDPTTKTFSWIPDFSQAGAYNIQIKANDGTAESVKDVAITVQNTNRKPALDAIPDQTVGTGENFSFQVSATDPDGDPLTFSAANLPEGATFNPTTKTFSWTPSETQVGEYPISFSVSDGTLSDIKTVKITVIIREDSSIVIISPQDGQTLTGLIILEAQLTEGVSASGIQFQLDGVSIGSEITASPYKMNYNTTQKPNGNHKIRAILRKTDGTMSYSSSINVVFSNEKIPPVILSSSPAGTVPFGTKCVVLSVTTNEEVNCRYSTSANTSYETMTQNFTKLPVVNSQYKNEVQVCGLEDAKTYKYYVKCQDISLNITPEDYFLVFTVGKAMDINKDNLLNEIDLNLLKADFLKFTGDLADARSDINGDGQVTIKDVGILMSEWR